MEKTKKKTAGKAGRKNRKRLHKKSQRSTGRKKALSAIFAIILTLAAGIGILSVFLYFSGREKIRGEALGKTPDAELMTDEKVAEDIRRKAGLSALQWQDDWVAFDGKVYSYDSSRINLLVLGVDKAGKMNTEPDYEKWLSGQTDAIFVVSINSSERKISILGVPRNSMVNVDVYDSEENISRTIFDQICLQYPYAGGAEHGLKKTTETVSELLYNLPIHGTAAVGYEALIKINNMAGGVDVVALESLETPFGYYKEGENLHLEGKYALAYVRARNVNVLGSPTMRLERQKQYLAALADRMKEEMKKNPMLIKEMYDAVSGYVNTDMEIDELVYLAAQAAGYPFSVGDIYLLQGEDRAVPIIKDGEETEDFYDDFYLDEESLKETMIGIFYKEVELEEQKTASEAMENRNDNTNT